MSQLSASPSPLFSAISAPAAAMLPSELVDIARFGQDHGPDDLIPLWVGEGELPTPDFICDAASASLAAGETFYTDQRGIVELRRALVAYHEGLYGARFHEDQFFITCGGMSAVQIALGLVAGAGDNVVIATPGWPNSIAAAGLLGITPRCAPAPFGNRGWEPDLGHMFDLCNGQTRAIFLTSPANPTGWTASHEGLRDILSFARKHGLWIIADEVYNRFFYGGNGDRGARAPSFYDVMADDDRVLFVNTFSKNWAMTGWRVGWLRAPAELGNTLEDMIQYATSGVAVFVQRGACAALNTGEDWLAAQIERARQGRRIVSETMARLPNVRYREPDGAFYGFFSIDGVHDTMACARRMITEAGVGLAPGSAFGPGGEAFFRVCFAAGPDTVTKGMDRLYNWINHQNG